MKNWREIVKKAKSYKDVGQDNVWLDDADEKPWELVTKIEPGALHRFNTCVSISFYATHSSGLVLCWSEDMEPHSANGSGKFQIDVMAMRKIAQMLPDRQKPAFRKIMVDVAEHVKKQAEEVRSTAADLEEMYLQMERVIAP